MGLTTKEIGSSSFNDMISSVDRRSEYVENRAGANVTLNNFLTPYTLDNKSSILNAPCGYSNGMYASLRPVQTIGPELITNGDFATDSNWTKGTGWSIANGKASRTAQSGSTACDQSISLIAGKKYKIVYTLTISAGSFNVRFSGTTNVNGLSRTTSGTYVDYLVAATGNNTFRLVGANGSFVGSIDNVSVKEVTDADFDFTRGSSATRVNEKGLIEDVQILSGELVQNGDFEQIGSELINLDTIVYQSGWQNNNDGSATFDINNGGGSEAIQGGVLQVGKTYKFSYNVNFTGEGQLRLYTQNFLASAVTQSGTYTGTFVADGTDVRFKRIHGNLFTIDNVSVKEVGQNWTFETGWSMGNGKAVYDGLTATPLLQSNFSMTSLKKYRATIQVVDTSGSGNSRFAIKEDNNTAIAFTTYAEGTITLEFTSPTNGLFGIEASSSEGSFDITNVSVIEITDDTDIPRIDYTSGQGALLLEPQSTNKVTQSETFSSPWGLINATIESVNLSAPDGSTSVIKMSSSNTSNGEHKVRFSVGTNPATSSIFAKMGEVRYIMNRRNVPGSGWQSVVFDLQEGVVAANWYSSDAYPKITHYGNGWYRCEVYYSNVDHTETGWGLSNGTDQNFTPTNTTDGLYIWGAQQEDLSYATSYIPTEASTVTRLADEANNSGNANLINSTEGVLYAEFSDFSNNVSALRFINIADVSNVFQNRISLGFRQDNRILFEVKNNNNTEMVYFDNTTNVLQFNKMCIKYKNNDCSVFINGVKVHEDNSATIPSNLNTLIMAGFTNGTYAFQGNVKSVAVFKEALTDAELAQITSATQQEVFYEMRDRMLQINADYYEFDDYTTRLKKLF